MSFMERLRDIFARKKRLGLVLGSGGARGLAHIGVLKVLDEAGIPLHCLVGTSAGALVGGLYCAGTPPGAIEDLLGGFSLKGVARMLIPTRGQGGIVDGKRVEKIIKPYVGGRTIEELSPRFACVATDLTSGEEVVFRSGELLGAIRSSISIPGLFTPVLCGDKILVDGAVVNPLPIELAFELGADFAIVVHVGRPYMLGLKTQEADCSQDGRDPSEEDGDGRNGVPSAVEVLLSALSIYDQHLSEWSISRAGKHLLVRPVLEGIDSLDFHKGDLAIASGEEAMRTALPELERLIPRARRIYID